jgi:hypothetical protein
MALFSPYTSYLDNAKKQSAMITNPTPKADPIAANIKANPNYESPATIMGVGTGAEKAPKYDANSIVVGNGGYDANAQQQKINDMYTAQQANTQAQLQAKRDAAISRLNQQATTIAPYYEGQRATLGGQVQQSRNKFSEYLANRGLSRSGAAAQAEISNQGRLQSGLAGLGQSEAEARAEIERQKELANQDYAINYDAVQQQILSDKTNALLNEQKYGDTLQRQLKQDALNAYNTDYQNKFNSWLTNTNMGREDVRNKVLDTRYTDTQDYNRSRDTKTDMISEQDRYGQSIKGLGNQMDYQGEINKVQNDGDTSNDWKIPYLQKERESKLQGMLQNDMQTIGQYNNDYQAEINRRQSTPDTTDDRLIPFLKIAQAEKISQMKSGQATAQQTQQKNALDLWKQLGVATPEIAKILGVPEGATTREYLQTQYDVKKPYYDPNKQTAQEKGKETESDVLDTALKMKADPEYYKMAPSDIKTYILNSNLPDEAVMRVMNRLGL